MKLTQRGYPWRLGLPVSLYYAVLAIFQGYNSKFFQQAGIQADSTQMMFLMASLPMVALFAQPLWGILGDRARLRNTVLWVMILGAAVALVLLPMRPVFGWMMAACCLYAAFFTPIQPMMDSILLERMVQMQAPFGPIRLMGSLCFGVVNLTLAGLFEGRFHLVPWAAVLTLGGLLWSVRVLPPTPGHQRGLPRVPILSMLRVPHMVPLLALGTLLQLAMGYYYSFFPLHFTSLPGGTAGRLGLGFFISAVFEVPFLLNADRWYRRLGAGRLLTVSALLLVVRFAIMGLANTADWMLVSQTLHGGCYIVITVATAMYINDTVPDELKSGGQMLLSAIGYGLARVFGTFLGGYVARASGGMAGGFLAMGGLCLAALLVFVPWFWRLPPLNGLPPQGQPTPG